MQEAQVYSHGGSIRYKKCRCILTADQSDTGSADGLAAALLLYQGSTDVGRRECVIKGGFLNTCPRRLT
eukprot:1740339-Pyramimonas_sp.AAC.1